MWALEQLLEREALGQQARYERFMAKMMYIVAAGKHIDMERVESFGAQIDEIYENPFTKKTRTKQPETAEEIKQYVLCLLEGKEWTS